MNSPCDVCINICMTTRINMWANFDDSPTELGGCTVRLRLDRVDKLNELIWVEVTYRPMQFENARCRTPSRVIFNKETCA